MATKIVTKNSSTASAVPTASDLVQGELAVNVADKRLFTEDNGGSIVELGTNPSTLTVTGEITANGGIALGDNDRIKLGDGPDLQIWHNGSDSYVMDSGTGNLKLLGSAAVEIQSQADNSNMIVATAGGAVTLYNANAPKLATTSTGIDVTGTATMDAATVQTTGSTTAVLTLNNANGNGTLSQINLGYTADPDHGNISYTGDMIFTAGAAERMRIDSSGNIQQATSVNGDLTHKIYNANTGTATQASLYITNSSANADGFFAGVNGSSATTASGFVQDGAYLGSGTGASGGLSIMTRANADMRFYTNGHTNERMRIESSGNVGIGTSSPSTKVEISGTGFQTLSVTSTNSSPVLKLNSAASSTAFLQWNNAGSSPLSFYDLTASAERMRIDTSGNLLVGLSSTSGIATGSTADNGVYVDGTEGAIVAQSSANKNLYLSKASGYSDPDFISFQVNGASVGSIGVTSGSLGIGQSSTGLGFFNTDSIVFPATAAGATRDNAIDLGYSGGRFKDLYLSGGALTSTVKFLANTTVSGSDSTIFRPADNTMAFSTNGAERLRIDSLGNLMVGKTSVSDSVAGGRIASDGRMIQGLDGTGAADFHDFFRGTAGSLARVGNIRSSGTSVAYNTSSDQRLKENIADADDAGSKVDSIQVRKFDWKADGSHQDYGMIAQELEAVAPEAVSGDADSEEMMGVDYSKLVPMLVKEIQSLRQRVAQLEE